ncbi:MAG: alpha/beta hydrolase [Firmicutes bacterium]|nr:alpha/beta hydrolase [Bacillota bacterium]
MKRIRAVMIIIIIIMLILLVIIAGAGWYMAGFSMGIQPQTYEHARKWQEDHYSLDWHDELQQQGLVTDYTVESYDSYLLHTELLKNPKPSDKYMIVSHGYTDNHFGALKYSKMYLDLGFNIIVYDLRGHGANESTFCTYSARERKDVLVQIEDCRKRYGNVEILGIHGESLGGASSIACLESNPGIDFVVDDCGFSNISDVLKVGVKHMKLPAFMVDVASLMAKLRFGYSYKDMRPIESLAENQIPILFLHGEKDAFITPKHSYDMQKATAGYSELYLIQGADHAMSVLTDPEGYQKHVEGFLKNIGIL